MQSNMTSTTGLEPFPPFIDFSDLYGDCSQQQNSTSAGILSSFSSLRLAIGFSGKILSVPNLLEQARRKLALWYYRYEVTLCLYVLEPWERWILNSFVLLCAGLLLAAVFVPCYHVATAYFGLSTFDSSVALAAAALHDWTAPSSFLDSRNAIGVVEVAVAVAQCNGTACLK